MVNLVIGGTLFPHKEIHKLTWFSPNQRDKNQIDHLPMSGKWRRCLQEVCVGRVADVGSDHYPVVAHIKLKLRRTGTQIRMLKSFDVSRLKDTEVRKQFILQVCNCCAALEDLDEERRNTEDRNNNKVEQNWKDIVQTYTESSRLILGQKRNKHKEWLSEDTCNAIMERKQVKAQWLKAKSHRLRERYGALYGEVNKRVMMSARTDKKLYIDNLAAEAERAAEHQEQGTIFRITKQICGGPYSNHTLIRDNQGNMLTSDKEQKKRWVEHFEEVLNREDPLDLPDIPEVPEDLDINVEPPTKEEIVSAIKELENRKAQNYIHKARGAFFRLKPVWRSTIYFRTKLRLPKLCPLFTIMWLRMLAYYKSRPQTLFYLPHKMPSKYHENTLACIFKGWIAKI